MTNYDLTSSESTLPQEGFGNILIGLPNSSQDVSLSQTGLENTHIEPIGILHTDRQPVEFRIDNPDNYTFLHPRFSFSAAEEDERRISAWQDYRRAHHEAWMELNSTPSRRAPVPEVLYITKDPADKAIFVLDSVPWAPLREGTLIECKGELVGVWKATAHLDWRHDLLCNLWRREDTDYQAWVRVGDQFKLPTLRKRFEAKVKGWKRMKKQFFASRPKNKATQTTGSFLTIE